MEFGQYQLQIFVSLVVVLGAAFVALICDLLKSNNEQLRELAIELKVRREEEQRRSQTMLPQAMTSESTETLDRVESPPERVRIERRARPTFIAPVRDIVSEEQRVEHAVEANPTSVLAAELDREEATPLVQTVVAKKAGATKAVATKPVATTSVRSGAAGKKDWGSLLSRSSATRKPIELQKDLMDAVAASASQREEDAARTVAIPTGFHEGRILSRLLQSRQPFTGLVVSIGISISRTADGSMPDAVVDMIRSLIGAEEFACQSSYEEFLLLCPSERGASAQRRLSQIAQQLWDFQLRSLGKFSILFSWGGVEVCSESIDEAIASAHDRMHETKRGRKLLLMPRQELAFRQAV
jgi:hypothetical protein